MNWKLRGKHKQDGEPTPEDLVKIKTVGSNKNFVNMEDVEEKNSNGMVYNIKNNVLTIKGTATANTTLIFNSKISVDLKANAYTLNANKNGSLTGVFGYYIYGSTAQSSARKTLIDGGNLASSTNTGIKTQILNDDYYNCCFAIYFGKNCTANMTLTPKLEKGSIATPYSPFGIGSVEIDVVNNNSTKSQTVIMPVQQEMLEGDYVADVEHHEWKKLVLTGDETITYYDAPSTEIANNLDTAYFTIGISEKAQGNLNNIISNMFKNLYTASAILGNASSTSETLKESISVDSVIRLRINKDRLEGYENSLTGNEKITLLKTYIKSKYDSRTPIIIYYKLATPINLELTEEQKAIREQKLNTYKNITNINLSDKLASIDIEYKKDQDTINKNYENRLAALESASIS